MLWDMCPREHGFPHICCVSFVCIGLLRVLPERTFVSGVCKGGEGMGVGNSSMARGERAALYN